MPASPLSSPPTTSPSRQSEGQAIAGRFTLEQRLALRPYGAVWTAREVAHGGQVLLTLVQPEIPSASLELILPGISRETSELAHRNLVMQLDAAKTESGQWYVVSEWIEGGTLGDLMERRRREGTRLSLRGAYNILAHVCRGLAHAHRTTAHGAVRPEVIWIARSGRVRVGELGLARALLRSVGPAGLGPLSESFIAPEVRRGGEPDARSDVFSVGALFYYMLTGRDPASPRTPAAALHSDCSPAVDEVITRAMSENPSARPESVEELRLRLLPVVAAVPVESGTDTDIELDVDVELASSLPPPPAGLALDPFAAAPALAPTQQATQPESGDPAQLNEWLSRIMHNDAPRWMVVKDRLDHGPFSGRELVQMVLEGDVLETHAVLNMDTGERRPIGDFDEFAGFVHQAALRREAQAQKALVQQSEQRERRSTTAKVTIGLAAAVGLALVGSGVVLALLERKADEGASQRARLAALYEAGEVGTVGLLPDPPKGRRRRSGRRSGGASKGDFSYEEAMNQAANLGDVSGSGGQQRLSSSKVASVMNRHINSFFGCVGQELKRGSQLGKVQIDLAISGSGEVQGVSVRQGSKAFQDCVAAKVRRVRFPSFAAPRMGARYGFSVD